MTECNKWSNDDAEAVSNPKNYCLGCLCDSNEKQVRSHTFVCPLKELLQMESINLCYLCKRIAQHAELFIQSVQINQLLMENFSGATDETLKSVKLQTQPLVNLQQVSNDVIELSENDISNFEESFTVVNSSREKDDLNRVKIEMKEEAELLESLEAEFINEDDEFPEMYVKEEEDFPLNTTVKEELGFGSVGNLNILKTRPTLKKKLKKKCANKSRKEFPEMYVTEEQDFPLNTTVKEELGIGSVDNLNILKIRPSLKKKLKKNGVSKSRKEMPEVKMIYITRKQCLEERARLSKDQQYLGFPFKCADCLKGFTFKGSYDTHMEKHNESNGDYVCDICKQRMDSDDKLVSHMRYHLIRYKCPVCGITRHCRKTIKDHYSVYHLGASHQYKCLQCLKVFKRKASLSKHAAQRHARRERVACSLCARSYVDKAVLKAHMILKHSKEVSSVEVLKKYMCPECGMGFRTPSQLRNHSVKHSDSREFYCVECDKSFKSEGILKTHLKTAAIHVNYKELPLSCLHCEKRFSNRRDVERHTNRVHLNLKPFRCDRCDKAYVNSWALKDHKRYIHEGYKRPLQYQCPMCDKAFDRNQILKSHIRTHTGERPYQCPKCPAQFSQASILRTHDRLIHLKLTRDGRPKIGAMK